MLNPPDISNDVSSRSPVLAPRDIATTRCWDMPLMASHMRKQSKLLLTRASVISTSQRASVISTQNKHTSSSHQRTKSEVPISISTPTSTCISPRMSLKSLISPTSKCASPYMKPQALTSSTSPTSLSRSMTPKVSTTPTSLSRSMTPKSWTSMTSPTSLSMSPSTSTSSFLFSPTATSMSAASMPGVEGLHSLTLLLHDTTKTPSDSWEHQDISQQAQHIQKQYQARIKMKERANWVKIQGKSEIVKEDMLKKLVGMTPDRHMLNEWQLKYSMTRDGVSYSRFFHNLHEQHGSVVIISDVHGSIFGGYAPSPWMKENEEIYYGTGEAFVYKIQGTDIQLYPWSGENDFYMLSSKTRMAMGGGDSFAWSLDTDFRHGSSGACRTFDSPCLSSSHNFMCVSLEVWTPSGDMMVNVT